MYQINKLMAENRKIYLQYREARNSAGELIDPNYDGLKLKIRKRAFKFRDDLISRELDKKLTHEELQYYFLRSFHEILHGYEQTIQEILGDLDDEQIMQFYKASWKYEPTQENLSSLVRPGFYGQ